MRAVLQKITFANSLFFPPPLLINFTLDFDSVPANPTVTPCSTEAS